MKIFEKLESLGFFEWLKEKGFGSGFTAMILDNQPVDSIERTGYNAIAFRWFREKYGLFIQPNRTIDSEGTWYYFSIASKRTDVCEGSFVYEEAKLSCLEKLIKIVESKSE